MYLTPRCNPPFQFLNRGIIIEEVLKAVVGKWTFRKDGWEKKSHQIKQLIECILKALMKLPFISALLKTKSILNVMRECQQRDWAFFEIILRIIELFSLLLLLVYHIHVHNPMKNAFLFCINPDLMFELKEDFFSVCILRIFHKFRELSGFSWY